jgi:hypothetical protein
MLPLVAYNVENNECWTGKSLLLHIKKNQFDIIYLLYISFKLSKFHVMSQTSLQGNIFFCNRCKTTLLDRCFSIASVEYSLLCF